MKTASGPRLELKVEQAARPPRSCQQNSAMVRAGAFVAAPPCGGQRRGVLLAAGGGARRSPLARPRLQQGRPPWQPRALPYVARGARMTAGGRDGVAAAAAAAGDAQRAATAAAGSDDADDSAGYASERLRGEEEEDGDEEVEKVAGHDTKTSGEEATGEEGLVQNSAIAMENDEGEDEDLDAFIDDDYFQGEDGGDSVADGDDESWYSVSTAEVDDAAARRVALEQELIFDSKGSRDVAVDVLPSGGDRASDFGAPLDLGAVDEAGRELLAASGYARVLNIDVDEGGALEIDDDNNDLFSGIGFDVMLDREGFVQNLNNDFGFKTCTHVQLVAIPRIADGEDIVMQSYTGTGKTIAFLLPLLERIDESLQAVQAVIVAPTRELGVQIANECARLCANTGILSMPLIGGANPQRQVDKLRRSTPHVVIGTPGRLAELNQNRVLRLRKARMVVVDEVDQCLEDDFRVHLEAVLSGCPTDRQLVFCSATGDKDIVRQYAQLWMRKPALIRVSGKLKVPANISHWSTVVPARMRIDVIRKLMYTKDPPTSAICFVDDPRRVDIVCERLFAMNVPAGALRGNAHKLERAEVIRLFRKGQIRLLVTTEVAARGLDVPAVSHVFNLDLPTDADHYIHRAGRCGRARAPGTVVTIASPETAFVIRRLEKQLEVSITPMELHGGEYAAPLQREQVEREGTQRSRTDENTRTPGSKSSSRPVRSTDGRTRSEDRFGKSTRSVPRSARDRTEIGSGSDRQGRYPERRDSRNEWKRSENDGRGHQGRSERWRIAESSPRAGANRGQSGSRHEAQGRGSQEFESETGRGPASVFQERSGALDGRHQLGSGPAELCRDMPSGAYPQGRKSERPFRREDHDENSPNFSRNEEGRRSGRAYGTRQDSAAPARRGRIGDDTGRVRGTSQFSRNDDTPPRIKSKSKISQVATHSKIPSRRGAADETADFDADDEYEDERNSKKTRKRTRSAARVMRNPRERAIAGKWVGNRQSSIKPDTTSTT